MQGLDAFWGVWMWPLTVISSGVAAYMGSYLKKKGENLATHEDLQQLVIQVKQTAEAAKSIEARISDEYWSRQKVWEMKRDAVLEMVASLGQTSDMLVQMAGMHERRKSEPDFPAAHLIRLGQMTEQWNERMDDFDRKRGVASFLGGGNLEDQMKEASRVMRETCVAATKAQPFLLSNYAPNIRMAVANVRIHARLELGLDDRDGL